MGKKRVNHKAAGYGIYASVRQVMDSMLQQVGVRRQNGETEQHWRRVTTWKGLSGHPSAEQYAALSLLRALSDDRSFVNEASKAG